MTRQISIVAPVQDSTLALSQHQRDKMARFFSSHEGKYVQMTLRQQGKPRSNHQNRYYHGVVLQMIADETGHTPEEIHAFCKSMFLPRLHVLLAGHEIEVPKSTTTLSTDEFEVYLDRVRAFAAQELGIAVPLPHESL